MTGVIEADVIILGSGVAGALMAARLAEAGARVAILEAGDEVERATALDRVQRAPIKVPQSACPPAPEALHPVAHRPGEWYGQEGPDAFSISLDPGRRDANGVPLPRLAFRLDDYVRAGLDAARAAHAEVFGRLGTSGVVHADRVFGAGHIMGTLRMGTDPRHSVVDPELRSHDHHNLFLLGSGAFPTGATANPTLTIAALALRAVGPVAAALRL